MKISTHAVMNDFNPRKEHRGEDLDPAMDLLFDADMKIADLGQLFPDSVAFKPFAGCIWSKDGAPQIDGLGRIHVSNSFEPVTVKVGNGVGKQIELPEMKVNKISFIPKLNGVAEVKFRVQGFRPSKTADIFCDWEELEVDVEMETMQSDMLGEQ